TAQLPSGAGPSTSVALVDADEDGDLDAFLGGGGVRLFVNNGAGAFAQSTGSFPVGTAGDGIAVGDFDGEGRVDVLVLGTKEARLLRRAGRTLAWRALPRVGKALTLDIDGPPFGAWFLVAAAGTGNTPLPPLGVIRLDLATLMPQFGGLLDAQGHAAVTYQVPAISALVGQSLYWQAIVVGPARLTNLERTTFSNL
ncbi:MAG TPA: VCBS repeat-containing protein, partial [Planctomycetota bacterium]|nr:VCBS repeat-containing protein [Planctomycetota bacterium]